MSGIVLMKVRDMLGHSSVKQTERYAYLHPDAHEQEWTILFRTKWSR